MLLPSCLAPNRVPWLRDRPIAQAAAAAQEAPTQGDDVYAYEPQLLQEGVRKHMLSVFVAGACAWEGLDGTAAPAAGCCRVLVVLLLPLVHTQLPERAAR